VRASEIARLVGGTLEGGHDPDLTGVAPLDRAAAEELTFLASPRYLPYLAKSRGGALLIAQSLADRERPTLPRHVVGDGQNARARGRGGR